MDLQDFDCFEKQTREDGQRIYGRRMAKTTALGTTVLINAETVRVL